MSNAIKYTKIFINNEWQDAASRKTFATTNPATGEVNAQVQEGDKADIDRAVAAARKAFALGSTWRTMDASKRADLLLRFADLIQRDVELLAKLTTIDNGKVISDARDEIEGTVGSVKYYAGFCDKVHGKTVPIDGDYFAYTRVEPVGVVGLIIPWNYPVELFAAVVAPILAAGNVAVIKPAEQTPLVSLHLASLVKEAGFPAGVLNVVPGYGPTAGAALANHMDVDQISFTGSRDVGKIVTAASANSNLKKVTLELGGKSPLIISQHSNLKTAVEIAQLACYYYSGQVCCAGTRIYVHESIYNDFVDASTRAALNRKVGDPFVAGTEQGPQVDEEQLTKILDLIESGKKQGANLKCGGKRIGNKGYFVEPTIFADVTDDMRIAKEEIFGPVMQIFKYKNLDEAIERANNTEYGLAAGIVTDNIEEALHFSHSVRAGSVWVNAWYASTSALPFGGYKQSGNGRTGGAEGIYEYMEVKTVSIKIQQKNA